MTCAILGLLEAEIAWAENHQSILFKKTSSSGYIRRQKFDNTSSCLDIAQNDCNRRSA